MAITVPATSHPRTMGNLACSRGMFLFLPALVVRSTGLTPAAATATRTDPAARASGRRRVAASKRDSSPYERITCACATLFISSSVCRSIGLVHGTRCRLIGIMEQSKRATTRERLVHATAILLSERGPSGTGTAQILNAADAPRGSFYHHFPGGKDELVQAAVRSAGDETAERIREVFESSLDLPGRMAQYFDVVARQLR